MIIKDLIFQIKDVTFDETLEYLTENAKKGGKKMFVVTVNTEIVMLAKGDGVYEKVIKSADLLVNDSIGIVFARKIFGKSSQERIHGVDLLEKLSEAASKQPITVGYLGGGKNVALDTANCLAKKYKNLKIAFSEAEWDQVEGKKCDILFVAFGSPKQEKWIYDNLSKINVKVAIGVGGGFDFISGRVKRAPKWMRKLGFEWLFRLIMQPWRIKRQIVLPKFVFLVLKERFFN